MKRVVLFFALISLLSCTKNEFPTPRDPNLPSTPAPGNPVPVIPGRDWPYPDRDMGLIETIRAYVTQYAAGGNGEYALDPVTRLGFAASKTYTANVYLATPAEMLPGQFNNVPYVAGANFDKFFGSIHFGYGTEANMFLTFQPLSNYHPAALPDYSYREQLTTKHFMVYVGTELVYEHTNVTMSVLSKVPFQYLSFTVQANIGDAVVLRLY